MLAISPGSNSQVNAPRVSLNAGDELNRFETNRNPNLVNSNCWLLPKSGTKFGNSNNVLCSLRASHWACVSVLLLLVKGQPRLPKPSDASKLLFIKNPALVVPDSVMVANPAGTNTDWSPAVLKFPQVNVPLVLFVFPG